MWGLEGTASSRYLSPAPCGPWSEITVPDVGSAVTQEDGWGSTASYPPPLLFSKSVGLGLIFLLAVNFYFVSLTDQSSRFIVTALSVKASVLS